MTNAEFKKLTAAHGLSGRSVKAARLVLVGGLSGYAVARRLGIDKSTISRALARLRRPLCPCCGQPTA